MFPIPWNKMFRNKDGTLTKIGDVIASGGGGSSVDGVYVGEDDPDEDLGEDGDFYLKIKKVKEKIALIPAVSDDTNVICSEEWTPGGESWHLFDNSLSTYWSTREGYNTNEYCGYDFGENGAVIATSAGICPRRWGSSNQIQDFKIQASNDNETWVDLYSGSIPNNAANAGVMNYFEFENSTAYRYYRLFVVNANLSQTITVFEFQLYTQGSEYTDVEIEEEFKKVNGSWGREIEGYKFQTHSTGGSDASIDVYIKKYGVYEFYGTILYNASTFEDDNVSLKYQSNWILTPKRTLYDSQGNVVTQQTWTYSVEKLFEWFVDNPT